MKQTSAKSRRLKFSTPEDTRLYAVGDIHGRKDLLDSMLLRIVRNATRSDASRRVVVFLGDYVDRGTESRAVLETLLAGPPKTPHWDGFEWVFLRGNHEDVMLRFLDDLSLGANWLREGNGGLTTIQSYAPSVAAGRQISSNPIIDSAEISQLQAALRMSLPPNHIQFLTDLPYAHQEGDYYFAHAGIRPGTPLDQQTPEDLMWIREGFLSSDVEHDKLVVHGHTIFSEPDIKPNRIGIDTGAYRSGRLTALVAEGNRQGFLST